MSGLCEKTIVCFANSRKPPAGTCVAGREFTDGHFGAWLRPVSHRPTRELLPIEQRCRDGREPAVLDIVRIPVGDAVADRHQTENRLIEENTPWTRVSRLSWASIQSAVENPAGSLWPDGESSQYGVNDRVSVCRLDQVRRSLYLIRPAHLFVHIGRESRLGGPALKKIRAAFLHAGQQYLLAVTDPRIERQFIARDEGDYELAEALLCLSLSEPYYGYAYKLAATIITPPRSGNSA